MRPLPPPGASGKVTPPPPPVRQAAPHAPSGIDIMLDDDEGESVNDDELFEDSKV
jgi:hypothetical protein